MQSTDGDAKNKNEREESEDNGTRDAENVPDESEELSEIINKDDMENNTIGNANKKSSSSDDHSMTTDEDDKSND